MILLRLNFDRLEALLQTVVQPGDGQVQPAALLVVTIGKLLIQG